MRGVYGNGGGEGSAGSGVAGSNFHFGPGVQWGAVAGAAVRGGLRTEVAAAWGENPFERGEGGIEGALGPPGRQGRENAAFSFQAWRAVGSGGDDGECEEARRRRAVWGALSGANQNVHHQGRVAPLHDVAAGPGANAVLSEPSFAMGLQHHGRGVRGH